MEEDSLVGEQKNVQLIEKSEALLEGKQEEGNLKCEKKTPTWIQVWPQVLVSSTALSTCIQSGVGLAYSATLIPQLADDNTIANFTTSQASWIASLPAMSTPVGAVIAGPAMEMSGRRAVLLFSCLAVTLSWIITYFTTVSLFTLYIARMLIGLGSGFATAGLIYCAEVCCWWSRGPILCLNSVAVAMGILLSTGLGLVPWRASALILAGVSTISLLLCLFIPETPLWLYTHRSPHNARAVLEWLNRPRWLVEEEWERLERSGTECTNVAGGSKRTGIKRMWSKGLGILLGLFLVQQSTGVYVIVFYAGSLFQGMGDLEPGLDEFVATLVLGVVRLVSSIAAAALSLAVPRRPLLLISGLGVSLSYLSLSVLLWCGGQETLGLSLGRGSLSPSLPPHFRIPAVVSILSSVTFASLGLMVLPWVLIAELLPPASRGPASGLLVCFAYLLMFLAVKTFPLLLQLFPLSHILICCACFSLLSIPYIYIFLPETFRKTFREIQQSLSSSPITDAS